MKNLFHAALLTLAALQSTTESKAQMPYNVSVLSQTYQPLPAMAVTVNQSTVWTDQNNYVMPLGFTFNLNGKATNKIALVGGNFIAFDTVGTQSGFVIISSIMRDRGTTASLSPIRYTTTGTAGSHIFKLELFNAGFDEEIFTFGTNNDSTNLQVWLYEAGNIVEIRYGGFRVSHFLNYFDKQLQIGFVKNLDKAMGTIDKAYILTGNPTTPTVDSITMTSTNNPGFSTMPSNTTVFRFTPKASSSTGIISVPAGTLSTIYPTICANVLNVQHFNNTPTSYQVVSMSGYTVLNGNITGASKIIDVAGLPSGIYQIRLSNAGQTELQRFVKL